jgi:hypothetical protein
VVPVGWFLRRGQKSPGLVALPRQAVVYRRLKDQQHGGWMGAWILPTMRFGSFKYQTVAGFEGIYLLVNRYFKLTGDAMNEFFTWVTDRRRCAAAVGLDGIQEWFQLPSWQIPSQVFDPIAIVRDLLAVSILNVVGRFSRLFQKKIGNWHRQRRRQTLQGGDRWGVLAPFDAADGVNGQSALLSQHTQRPALSLSKRAQPLADVNLIFLEHVAFPHAKAFSCFL